MVDENGLTDARCSYVGGPGDGTLVGKLAVPARRLATQCPQAKCSSEAEAGASVESWVGSLGRRAFEVEDVFEEGAFDQWVFPARRSADRRLPDFRFGPRIRLREMVVDAPPVEKLQDPWVVLRPTLWVKTCSHVQAPTMTAC